MKKTQRQLADEAYLRQNTEAGHDGALAGQLDAVDGTVAGARTDGERTIDEIPPTCPSCNRSMTIRQGWTPLSGANAIVGVIMCGNCGQPVTVSRGAYDALKAAIKACFATADQSPLVKARGKRERGAG